MDCSKTINFFFELRRLCDSRATCGATAHDEQCPLHGFSSSRIQKSILKMLKGQLRICKNGATNSRRKHTRRTSLKNSQKRRAIRTEHRLRVEIQYTAEGVWGQEALDAGNAGTNRWRNDNG